MKEYSIIGKRLPRVDAKEKVKGTALYTDDISMPGTICGMILRRLRSPPRAVMCLFYVLCRS